VLVTRIGARASAPASRYCEALRRVARLDGVELVYPVHPNPRVAKPCAATSRASQYPSHRAARLYLLRGFDEPGLFC